MNEKMTKSRVQALLHAIARKRPDKGLIAHSNQVANTVHMITKIYYNNLAWSLINGVHFYQWSPLLTAHLTGGM